MSQRLTLLDTPEQLDAALEHSFSRPVLIFKHSLTCGMSAWAYREFEALLGGEALPVDACLVHIQNARPVSSAIAERLRVRHESPQALLVVNGAAAWHASHGRLTRDAMRAAAGIGVAAPR